MKFAQKVKVLAIGAGVAASLLAGSAMAEIRDLTGTVAYRERVALPPDALVEVTLEDVSRADAASVVLARQTLKPEGPGRKVCSLSP